MLRWPVLVFSFLFCNRDVHDLGWVRAGIRINWWFIGQRTAIVRFQIASIKTLSFELNHKLVCAILWRQNVDLLVKGKLCCQPRSVDQNSRCDWKDSNVVLDEWNSTSAQELVPAQPIPIVWIEIPLLKYTLLLWTHYARAVPGITSADSTLVRLPKTFLSRISSNRGFFYTKIQTAHFWINVNLLLSMATSLFILLLEYRSVANARK